MPEAGATSSPAEKTPPPVACRRQWSYNSGVAGRFKGCAGLARVLEVARYEITYFVLQLHYSQDATDRLLKSDPAVGG